MAPGGRQPATDWSLADRCAIEIRNAFMRYNEQFRAITRRAQGRFEEMDWSGGRKDAVERIDLYDEFVNASVAEVTSLLGVRITDRELWRQIKHHFEPLVHSYPDVEFTRTYFSSVTRRVFKTAGIDPEIEFVGDETIPLRNIGGPVECRTYVNTGSLEQMFGEVLEEYAWSVPYVDAAHCAARIASDVVEYFRTSQDNDAVQCCDFMEAVFYRDTRAYLVGKLTGWTRVTPIVIALKNGAKGIDVEAVIQTENGVSIIFGYARSYFHVDLEIVGAAIVFLRRILPRKPVNELFTVLGRAKQGKTERYRDFARHLEHSFDRFVFAPGDKGLVMLVFTLPSYDVVFKVIRDRFGYPKNSTPEEVMGRYDLVFKHDKPGRLVDTQEFRLLKFHRGRFTAELLEELLSEASRTVRLEGDYVMIDHVYIERRLRPLNLYIRQVGEEAARRAVLDYGQSIRDLALTNIFPGDLLLKNFGVSRNGRVIFYDYDELCLVTDCRFRDLPEADSYEDEMRGEAWFFVDKADVFPEQFGAFLGLKPPLKAALEDTHGDLFEAAFWRHIQRRIRAGEVFDVLPYHLPGPLPSRGPGEPTH